VTFEKLQETLLAVARAARNGNIRAVLTLTIEAEETALQLEHELRKRPYGAAASRRQMSTE
jgi:hypothetical protein